MMKIGKARRSTKIFTGRSMPCARSLTGLRASHACVSSAKTLKELSRRNAGRSNFFIKPLNYLRPKERKRIKKRKGGCEVKSVAFLSFYNHCRAAFINEFWYKTYNHCGFCTDRANLADFWHFWACGRVITEIAPKM